MLFSKLLLRLVPFGLAKISSLEKAGHGIAMIGDPSKAVYPFQFQYHSLYFVVGETDWDVSVEEIDALRRRFKISDDAWQDSE